MRRIDAIPVLIQQPEEHFHSGLGIVNTGADVLHPTHHTGRRTPKLDRDEIIEFGRFQYFKRIAGIGGNAPHAQGMIVPDAERPHCFEVVLPHIHVRASAEGVPVFLNAGIGISHVAGTPFILTQSREGAQNSNVFSLSLCTLA